MLAAVRAWLLAVGAMAAGFLDLARAHVVGAGRRGFVVLGNGGLDCPRLALVVVAGRSAGTCPPPPFLSTGNRVRRNLQTYEAMERKKERIPWLRMG